MGCWPAGRRWCRFGASESMCPRPGDTGRHPPAHPACSLQLAACLDGVGGVNGDLVVGGIAVGQPQIVVLNLEVHVREDELRSEEMKRRSERSLRQLGGWLGRLECSPTRQQPNNTDCDLCRRNCDPASIAAATAAAAQQQSAKHCGSNGSSSPAASCQTPQQQCQQQPSRKLPPPSP